MGFLESFHTLFWYMHIIVGSRSIELFCNFYSIGVLALNGLPPSPLSPKFFYYFIKTIHQLCTYVTMTEFKFLILLDY